MAIDWSEIFQQGLRLLEPQFAEKTKVAESEKNTKLENLTKEGEAQTQKLTQIKEKAQKQAYISRMNAQRDLPSALAAQGIGGGASESVYAELLKNYENVRMEADNIFLTGVGELERELKQEKRCRECVSAKAGGY